MRWKQRDADHSPLEPNGIVNCEMNEQLEVESERQIFVGRAKTNSQKTINRLFRCSFVSQTELQRGKGRVMVSRSTRYKPIFFTYLIRLYKGLSCDFRCVLHKRLYAVDGDAPASISYKFNAFLHSMVLCSFDISIAARDIYHWQITFHTYIRRYNLLLFSALYYHHHHHQPLQPIEIAFRIDATQIAFI